MRPLPAASRKAGRSHESLARISLALSDQHARLADGAVPGPGSAGHAGRHSGRRAGPHGRDGVRLGLVSQRVADGAGRAADLALESRMATGVQGDAAGSARGGHRGLRVCDHRLHGASRAGRGCGAGATARAAPEARAPADARLRPEPHGAGSPLGGGPPGVFRGGDGARPGAGAAELYAGQAEGGRPDPGLWPGPVLRRLAGHAAARLQQSGHAGGDDRGAGEDRGAMRRRALRHGHARPAGRLRADLGPPGAACSGPRPRGA